jgi:hypothetical protein
MKDKKSTHDHIYCNDCGKHYGRDEYRYHDCPNRKPTTAEENVALRAEVTRLREENRLMAKERDEAREALRELVDCPLMYSTALDSLLVDRAIARAKQVLK